MIFVTVLLSTTVYTHIIYRFLSIKYILLIHYSYLLQYMYMPISSNLVVNRYLIASSQSKSSVHRSCDILLTDSTNTQQYAHTIEFIDHEVIILGTVHTIITFPYTVIAYYLSVYYALCRRALLWTPHLRRSNNQSSYTHDVENKTTAYFQTTYCIFITCLRES
jgi:hypothetical protein